MKLKQFLSTALALVMVLSLSIPVLAADYSTAVSYDGTGTERYELTVPSQLKPGTSGNVTLSGTWASNRHIAVTADKTVAMTGSLGGSETLDITFAGIDLTGDNEAAVSETKPVSVASLDALFGNWTGTFYYNVGASDVDPLEGVDLSQAVAFTITYSNRAAVGYTGKENENLVIPAYFIGDGKNGTTEGTLYKVTGISGDGNGGGSGTSAFSSGSKNSMEPSKLASVTIPNTVTRINQCAFYNCPYLTNIVLPDSVVFIGDSAFHSCENLVSISLPESMNTIEKRAFSGCSSLESINIPYGITSIYFNTFNACESLSEVVIPNTVTTIEGGAFGYCSSLSSINIPASVKIMDAYKSSGNWIIEVFCKCTNLQTININKSSNSISGSPWGATNATINWTD